MAIEHLEVRVQTVPDFDDIVTGKARVEDIRDVDARTCSGATGAAERAALDASIPARSCW